MENASKALLIAAAVLIVILLIAFGMRIMDSTGDTAGQVEGVGTAIAGKAGTAATEAIGIINGGTKVTLSAEQLNSQIESKLPPENSTGFKIGDYNGLCATIENIKATTGKEIKIDLNDTRGEIVGTGIPGSTTIDYTYAYFQLSTVSKDSNGYITNITLNVCEEDW